MSMSERYTIQNNTDCNRHNCRFTRDALINAHDAYITVELYNNYYICVILHASSCLLQVLLFIKALKAVNNNCIIIDYF